jgi:hypothetical protein
MDPKGKGMVVNDNEKESIYNKPRDDKVNDSSSSQKKKDGKKKRRIRKVVYYDSDESSSSQKDDDDDYDSVRCANGSKSPTVGCAKIGKKSAPDSVRWCTGLSVALGDRRQKLPS